MYLHRLVVVLLIVLYLLSPLLTDAWPDRSHAWYQPFFVWLGIILLIAWLERRHRPHA